MCNTFNSTKPALSGAMIGIPFKVKTKFEKPVKQFNLSKLNSSEVAALKTTDPFMYYSIPTVHEESMIHPESDLSTFDLSTILSDHPSKKRKTNENEEQEAHIITRKSRISCECYPDLLLGEPVDAESIAAEVDESLLLALSAMLENNERERSI